MNGFIKITEPNNQITYINISNIIKFYRKSGDLTALVTIDSREIECKATLEELVKLIEDASSL